MKKPGSKPTPSRSGATPRGPGAPPRAAGSRGPDATRSAPPAPHAERTRPRPSWASPHPTAPTAATPQRSADAGTEMLFGLRAVLAIAAARPDDLVQLGYGDDAGPEVEALAAWALGRGLRADRLDARELERAAASTHHEGLVAEVRARRWVPAAELADRLLGSRGAAVALDRVRNPYNVGAILRTAAFLGIDAALLGSPAPHPALAPDAVRVAEGGAERLALSRTTDLADTLGRLRARGIRVVGADQHGRSVFSRAMPRPAVLVLGHERDGLSERVRAACDEIVAIPGTGAVESLNVGVAAGLLMAELVRDRLCAH